MPPRSFTLPSAKTDSARAARSAFYCELCAKGYSRMNEFEAHESSYDHQHKKRLKEMKEMQRQVQTAGRKEEKGPLMSIKLGGVGKSSTGKSDGVVGGVKKGGFKNAFASVDDENRENKNGNEEADVLAGGVFADKKGSIINAKLVDEDEDSDVTDQEDYYDPRKPTGCNPGCPNYATA